MDKLTQLQISKLIGLVDADIHRSESNNQWQETPHSKDLREILAILQQEYLLKIKQV